MVIRYVVGKPETVDASTFRRFLGHLAFNGGSLKIRTTEHGKPQKLLKTRHLLCCTNCNRLPALSPLYVDHSIDMWRPKRTLKSEF
jgi:hypothetical protein